MVCPSHSGRTDVHRWRMGVDSDETGWRDADCYREGGAEVEGTSVWLVLGMDPRACGDMGVNRRCKNYPGLNVYLNRILQVILGLP
jgi:hypothetical protein